MAVAIHIRWIYNKDSIGEKKQPINNEITKELISWN